MRTRRERRAIRCATEFSTSGTSIYRLGPQPEDYRATFDLPGVIRADALLARYQGIFTVTGVPAARPVVSVGPEDGVLTALPPVTVPNQTQAVVELGAEDLASLTLADRNTLQYSQSVDAYGAALDYMDWTYQRSFRTFEDRISFQTSAWTGPRQFDLAGFGSFDIMLFEVSDSLAPKLMTYTEDQTFRQSGQRILRVQLDLGAAAERRVFTAFETSAARTPVAIERASDKDLAAPGDANLIVIVHPNFLPGAQPLITPAGEPGWRVEVATVREVFDQFDGDGRVRPRFATICAFSSDPARWIRRTCSSSATGARTSRTCSRRALPTTSRPRCSFRMPFQPRPGARFGAMSGTSTT
ncbi:MAG: hypothetical protein R3E12_06165 [Candidatus Eisenbacteria bacterium]